VNTEAEVDQLLASWDERLKRVDDNLIALESDPVYELLSGVGGKRAPLEGVTRSRVGPALLAVAELFEHRARLTEVVERAKRIRAGVSFWDKEEKLAEIKALLYGPSIKMATPPKPLAQRGLLDPSRSDLDVVPDRLLEAMSEAFLAARDEVTRVSQAWSRLEPLLEGVEGEVLSLKVLARELRLEAEVGTDLEWLECELGRVRATVATDPLGVSASVDTALRPRLGQLRRYLGEQKVRASRVAAGLLAAFALEREAKEVHADAREAEARVAKEILGALLPPVSDDALFRGLGPWREKIEETARAGRFGPADVGLARWNDTARAYIAQDRAVLAKVESLFAERAELGGRLAARRVQEEALLRRGTPTDPKLAQRGREAEALLSARPTPLADAAIAVDDYEALIVKLAAFARRG
jgi:hypothetical protein